MRKVLFMALAATLLLNSCSEDTEIGKSEEKGSEIAFRSFIDKGTGTRATVTDNSNILGFTVTGWWDKTTAGNGNMTNSDEGGYLFNAFDITRREGGIADWNYDPKIYWPSKGSGVYFYAYSPASSKNVASGEGLYNYTGAPLEYTVPDPGEKESQEDFLLARTGNLNASPVTLNFAHALSRVTFSAKKEGSGFTYLIDSIKLVKIKKSGSIILTDIPTTGSFTYTTTADPVIGWTPIGALDSISLDLGESPVYVKEDKYHSILGPINALMVMPQATELGNPDDPTSGFRVKVSYKAFIDPNDPSTYYAGSSSTSKHVYFPVADMQAPDDSHVFEIGRQYNFALTFGAEAGEPIKFSVEVGEWQDNPNINPPMLNYWFDGLISEKLAAKANSSYKTEGVTEKQILAVTGTNSIDVENDDDLKGLYYFKNIKNLTINLVNNISMIDTKGLAGLTHLSISDKDRNGSKRVDVVKISGSTTLTQLRSGAKGNSPYGTLHIGKLIVWNGFDISKLTGYGFFTGYGESTVGKCDTFTIGTIVQENGSVLISSSNTYPHN